MHRCKTAWEGPEFGEWFTQWYLRPTRIRGTDELLYMFDFYSGLGSKLVRGIGASQQYIEGLIGNFKHAPEVASRHNTPLSFFEAHEELCEQLITTPGHRHSLIGPTNSFRINAPGLNALSQDLLEKRRPVKYMRQLRWHPSVRDVVRDYKSIGGGSVVPLQGGRRWVIKAWKDNRCPVVSFATAASIARQLACRSEAALDEEWRRAEVRILTTVEGEDESPDLARLQRNSKKGNRSAFFHVNAK